MSSKRNHKIRSRKTYRGRIRAAMMNLRGSKSKKKEGEL